MDIRKIALYLDWKLPPYYKPFDKMEFIEELMWIFSDNFTEKTFNFISNQAKTDKEFYSMSLNKAKRINQEYFIFFLDKIWVPEDARYIKVKRKIIDKEIKVFIKYLINKDIKLKDFINTIKKCWINKDLSKYEFDFKSEKIYKRLLKELTDEEIIKI